MTREEIICSLLMLIFTYSLGFVLGFISATPRITAIDVYQGKTTLEVTYKDGVPIDTVVVFKEKEE